MLWFVFAVGSALCAAIKSMLHRKVMFKADPYAYAFLENVFTLLIFIPLALSTWSLPQESIAWAILTIGGVLWSAISVIAMYSYKHTQVSFRAPFSESKTLWVLLLSALLLAEIITTEKIIGVIVIFIGVVLLGYRKGAHLGSFNDKGVRLTLLVAFLSAMVAIVDKKALDYFEPNVYAMFVYLIPTIIVGGYALLQLRKDVAQVLQHQAHLLAFVVILASAAYWLELHALQLAPVSIVFPVLRLATVFTVLGGIAFMHEREFVLRKLTATAVVVIGVVLVSGYYTLF